MQYPYFAVDACDAEASSPSYVFVEQVGPFILSPRHPPRLVPEDRLEFDHSRLHLGVDCELGSSCYYCSCHCGYCGAVGRNDAFAEGLFQIGSVHHIRALALCKEST